METTTDPALAQGVAQYVAYRRHVGKLADRINDQLSLLTPGNPGDWEILRTVRALLDEIPILPEGAK